MNFEEFKPQIRELAEKYNLQAVALFGSQARGNTHPKSDIDIAIITKEKIDIIKLTCDFYNLFKREDVEVVDVSDTSPTLMYAVARDGKLLYEVENSYFDNWRIFAFKIFGETEWMRDLQKKTLLNWLEKNKQ